MQNGSQSQQQPQQTSNALARQSHLPAPFEPENLEQAERLADKLAKSQLLPEGLRGKPADIFATLITGRELGLSPMQAIRSIHIIKGKPSLSADLMVALVKRSSECVFFKLVKSDDHAATYATERRGEGSTELTFTMEQARAAGLLSNGTWKSYPAAMLRARASSALARAVYPDLVMGIYDPDELGSAPEPSVFTPPPAQQPTQKSELTVERDPEPAIDAEFTQAEEPPPAAQPETPLAKVLRAVEEATSNEDLAKAYKAVAGLPKAEKLLVKAPYEAKYAQLNPRSGGGHA